MGFSILANLKFHLKKNIINASREPAPTSSASVSRPSFPHIIISYRPSVVAVFFVSLSSNVYCHSGSFSHPRGKPIAAVSIDG